MAITIKHAKTDNISDWTQTDLDAQIALGNFPPGTVLADIVLPSDWNNSHTLSGTVPVANGGTGANTLTGYVKGNGTSAFTATTTVPSTDITGLGTMSTQNANSVAITGGSISGTTVSGYIPTTDRGIANGVASLDGSGTVPVSQLPAAVLGALSYQGTWNASTNTPTLTSSTGTKGYYYVVNVAGSTNLNGITDWQIGDWAVYNGSAWQKIDNTDAVTSVNSKTGTVVLTYSDITSGVVPVVNGGTGVTTSSGANSVVLRDANGNITTNCLFEGFTSQANGSLITLTASSVQNWVITGSGGQTIKLPDATTLPSGALFTFNNNQSSGTIVVQNNSGTTIDTLQSGSFSTVVLLNNSTAAGSWDKHDQAPANVSWSTNTFDYPGSITSATWNGNAIALNRGGTNANLTAVNGGAVYSTGTALAISAAGTSGQVLTSSGAGAPTWTTPTTGTVTSVTGTAPVVSSGGTTPAISMAAASSTVNGYLTSTDWTTFNSKGSGTVTSVSATSPVTSTGGATPTIAIPAATTSVSGYLTSTDWTTFNNKGSGTVTSVAVTAPSIFSVAGSPITSSGTIALTYSGTALPIANGGTGQTTASAAFNALSPLTTSGDILYGATSGAGTRLGIGTTGQVLTVVGGLPAWSTAGAGTVTSVSVVSANGFAGTVANSTSTPAITLTTSVTGVLKGNGTAISAATSGTDYSAGTSALATGILKSTTTTGALSIAVAADFPTLNQNTTGSAATLTTARAIYGNNFDGSAALTQIIASTYGGTGNGFTKFTGPATAEKTFTLPNASATILTDNAAVTVAQGGTGLTSTPANGALDIGNGTGFTRTTLTAGTGVSVTNASGSITIANTAPSVSWQSVQTSGFTAVAGNGYPCNTTSAAFTVTLPASPSAGNIITLTDYAGTWQTNNVTLDVNGNKLNSASVNATLSTKRQSISIVYIDSTQGWIAYNGFLDALPAQPYTATYLVVAGGGGGGTQYGGGGGAGGLLASTFSATPGVVYTATVGGGGAAVTNGTNSSISGSGLTTITATGGGAGGSSDNNGAAGGSGGGGGGSGTTSKTGGSGTSGQGFGGGNNFAQSSAAPAGGGGGSSAVGVTATSSKGGNGGAGTSSSITGSSVVYAGGGGGGGVNATTPGTGGTGGGGAGANPGVAGTANTGGGGGGGFGGGAGGSGGYGVIILSVPTANYSGVYTGTQLATYPKTSGSNTILYWTSSGTYTA